MAAAREPPVLVPRTKMEVARSASPEARLGPTGGQEDTVKLKKGVGHVAAN